ncbi:MAG: hypothetical protein IKA05_03555 [Clostridia bacterium]|nr:hypothetical protein [Clostridia bacterium]
MKCTQCGNDKLFRTKLEGPTDDGYWNSVDFVPFVCDKCGHVEFYVSQEVLEKYVIKQKEDIAEADFNTEKNEKIERIILEIQKLKVLIADENNTVKEVKEAKESLAIKERELNRTKNSFYCRKDCQSIYS